METRVDGIQTVATEQWVREDPRWRRTDLIKPVEGGGNSEKPRLKRQDVARATPSLEDQDKEELEAIVEDVQNYLQDLNIKLSFRLHQKTGDMVVSVVNKETGEVIRQIPPEELLELREKLEELTGVLLNGKV